MFSERLREGLPRRKYLSCICRIEAGVKGALKQRLVGRRALRGARAQVTQDMPRGSLQMEWRLQKMRLLSRLGTGQLRRGLVR